jgi:hypothetical protein
MNSDVLAPLVSCSPVDKPLSAEEIDAMTPEVRIW